MAREQAEHFWPLKPKAEATTPSTAASMSASAETMMASLPPISRMVRLMKRWPGWVLAARSWISRPTFLEPVKAMKRTFGAFDEGAAGFGAALEEVDDAVGQAGLFEEGEEARGDGGGVGRGLEDDGVAGDDGGGGHAGHDGEGEVPRRDDGADAERDVAEVVALAGVLDGRGGGVELRASRA